MLLLTAEFDNPAVVRFSHNNPVIVLLLMGEFDEIDAKFNSSTPGCDPEQSTPLLICFTIKSLN